MKEKNNSKQDKPLKIEGSFDDVLKASASREVKLDNKIDLARAKAFKKVFEKRKDDNK